MALWHKTFFTFVWIFNTGRGLSIFIRFPHNVGVMYDLGRSDQFSPTAFIAEQITPHLTSYGQNKVGQIVLSHPHQDHIQDISAVTDPKSALYPNLLTCPNDKSEDATERVDFSRIIRPDNRTLLEAYRESYSGRHLPLQTLQVENVHCHVPNVEYGIYYMRPAEVAKLHPNDDQLYCNGLSLVFYLRHGFQSLLIPGDVTPEVFARILEGHPSVERRYTYFSGAPGRTPSDFHLVTSSQPKLGYLLATRGLTAFVAPHHGLQSCYSSELFRAIKNGRPRLNIISEKMHRSETEGEVDSRYQSEDGALGTVVDVDGRMERRLSVSTINGHNILVAFPGTSPAPAVYLRKDARDLTIL